MLVLDVVAKPPQHLDKDVQAVLQDIKGLLYTLAEAVDECSACSGKVCNRLSQQGSWGLGVDAKTVYRNDMGILCAQEQRSVARKLWGTAAQLSTAKAAAAAADVTGAATTRTSRIESAVLCTHCTNLLPVSPSAVLPWPSCC